MSYIGSNPTSQNFISGTDYFNGTGSQTAFTLTRSVNSVNDVEVVVNNVIQQPSSYTVSGTTLTLSAAPSSGTSNVYVRYLATNQQSFTVGNNTVGYNQLTSDMQSKFAMKNRIINGAMVINQRAFSGTPNNEYTLDRWLVSNSQTGKFTLSQSTDAPTGFNNSILVTSSSAYSLGAGDFFGVSQRIEGYNIADLGFGTASAKTITISFWVKSSLTGTFSGAINNGAWDNSYAFTYSIPVANTWTQISVTIAGSTTGTWLTTTGNGMRVWFGLGVGATYATTANTWVASGSYGVSSAVSVVSTNAATFQYTGVQLEVGTSATGFEYRQYQQELALCQRYYRKTSPTSQYGEGTIFGYTNAGLAMGQAVPFPVTMRATPTAAYGGTWTLSNASYNAVEVCGTSGYFPYIAVASSGPAYQFSNSSGFITFNAEL